jgi:hypothetical protein
LLPHRDPGNGDRHNIRSQSCARSGDNPVQDQEPILCKIRSQSCARAGANPMQDQEPILMSAATLEFLSVFTKLKKVFLNHTT